MKHSSTCGELRRKDVGKEIRLNGWINRRRDHGNLIFIDLRDRYGITQIVIDPAEGEDLINTARKLSIEDVIGIRGVVRSRPENAVNKEMATGEIEILCKELEIYNQTAPLPFMITDRSTGHEDLRLTYRYLELRTDELQRNLLVRNEAYKAVREYYSENHFIEIETPFLMRSTPEGARDYLVPSRIHKGKFYALPQSPQTYKQLCMIAGFDRYFQIVRCFRDEDLRSDRQPEFTQIDVEMSFVDEEDVMTSTEKMIKHVFEKVGNYSFSGEFPRMSYNEVMRKYGSDKPDIRYGMELQYFRKFAERADFAIFRSNLDAGGEVAFISVPGGSSLSRKEIDNLTREVRDWGGKGLAFMKVDSDGLQAGISRFFKEWETEIIREYELQPGDLMLFISDTGDNTRIFLGRLRTMMAERFGLIRKGIHKGLWVVNFPLLEWDEDEGRWVAMHHPFTSPIPADMEKYRDTPGKIRARAYDLVIDGYEIGGGSIRNHTRDAQMAVFDLLGIRRDEAEEKFGFLLNALNYGAPPHGGIALGFDRLVMILAGADNIRDVIAFPKTTSATSLMDGSPSEIDEEQLRELGLSLSGNTTE